MTQQSFFENFKLDSSTLVFRFIVSLINLCEKQSFQQTLRIRFSVAKHRRQP